VVGGDLNVAPTSIDVWDESKAHGGTHVSEPERDRFKALLDWGLVDGYRSKRPEPGRFSWWDYRAGNFHKNIGMRIDHLLLSPPLADRIVWAEIDREARKGKPIPSDHAPLVIDVDAPGEMSASRVEIAHVQYYGWAMKNRAMLMPSRAQVDEAVRQVELLRTRHHGRIVIDAVVPDYFARFPKPCVGGWGRRSINVTPAGKVLPCHAAEVIPGLEFWNVGEHSLSEIWRNSPAFNAFRGEAWMQEPCRSCARREQDFGGCRCQAFLVAGDARATDPVCHLSPRHAVVEQLAAVREDVAYAYRRT